MPYDMGKGANRRVVTVLEHERKPPEHYGCNCGACSGWHGASTIEEPVPCTVCADPVLDGNDIHTGCMNLTKGARNGS